MAQSALKTRHFQTKSAKTLKVHFLNFFSILRKTELSLFLQILQPLIRRGIMKKHFLQWRELCKQRAEHQQQEQLQQEIENISENFQKSKLIQKEKKKQPKISNVKKRYTRNNSLPSSNQSHEISKRDQSIWALTQFGQKISEKSLQARKTQTKLAIQPTKIKKSKEIKRNNQAANKAKKSGIEVRKNQTERHKRLRNQLVKENRGSTTCQKKLRSAKKLKDPPKTYSTSFQPINKKRNKKNSKNSKPQHDKHKVKKANQPNTQDQDGIKQQVGEGQAINLESLQQNSEIGEQKQVQDTKPEREYKKTFSGIRNKGPSQLFILSFRRESQTWDFILINRKEQIFFTFISKECSCKCLLYFQKRICQHLKYILVNIAKSQKSCEDLEKNGKLSQAAYSRLSMSLLRVLRPRMPFYRISQKRAPYEDICYICMQETNLMQKYSTWQCQYCKHKYHRSCSYFWSSVALKKCPLCQHDMIQTYSLGKSQHGRNLA